MNRWSRRAVLTAASAAAVAYAGGCTDGAEAPPAGTPPRTDKVPSGLRFPEGFGWGAATSAYQIEGAAREDGRGPSIWDTFAREPGKVRNGDTGDVAADHYHRWAADLDLMKDLGLRSYRFSVSWPRILPSGTGRPNQKGVDFYRRLVDGLHQRDIAPMLTLFHWDLPQALQDKGGWENRDCAKWFADYAEVMFRALGGAVPTWLTLNEPKTVVNVGYQYGTHAPGKRDEAASRTAMHHLLLAHGLAVRAFRDVGTKARIGIALDLAPTYPAEEGDAAAAATRLADGFENRLYLDPVLRGSYPEDVLAEWSGGLPALRDGDLDVIAAKTDLLAIQYYRPYYVTSSGSYRVLKPTTQASWQQVYPEGLYDLLVRVKRDYGDIPLTITENGMPEPDEIGPDGTVDDAERITFLRDHLAAAHKAIQEGVRLESYHAWSLLDNFEWAEGYSQRWGLVYVDYATQRRVLKDSARWYKGVIAANGLP
jgi:beta-glucosidase